MEVSGKNDCRHRSLQIASLSLASGGIFAQNFLMIFHRTFPALTALILSACSAEQGPPQGIQMQAPPQAVVVRPENPTPPVPRREVPTVRAESAIVVDTLTGRILYEKNARTTRAVASTQKLLTALCVARAGSLDKQVTIQATDTQVVPTKIYVSPGETYTRRELVKALIVKSGNDVARALARDVSGSQEEFAALMNQTARSIGMTNSNFKNPHGLTEEGQYSTALDMAILAREVTKNPLFRNYMRIKEYPFVFPSGRTVTLKNTNKVLTTLPYCTGMKTGTTNASGRCLISSGVLNGRAVIVVALGSTTPEIWNDSEKLLRWALE